MCRPDTGNPWYPVPDPDLPVERTHIGALMTGRIRPASWGDAEPPRADLFAAKGVLEALMGALRVDFRVEPSSDRPFLHPRRAATVLVGEHQAGWLGELHPSVAAQWDLDGVAGFELDFGALAGAATGVPRYEDLTSVPAVRWDLAITVDRDVPSSRVVDEVRSAAGARLSHVEVFDVYEGPQVGPDKKSLALHLEFRAPDRTLTEDDARELVDKILAALREQLGATHRG